MLIEVNKQELAHILLALRSMQAAFSDGVDLRTVKEEDDVDAMTPDELGELVEELICPGEEIYVVWDPDQFEVLGVANRRVDAVALAEQFDDVVVRAFLTGKCADDGDD